MRRLAVTALLLLAFGGAQAAERTRRPPYNELSVEVPFDGGAVLMYSRMWQAHPRLDAGFSIGGGVIQRDFDTNAGFRPGDVEAHTEAFILPYIGPRITFNASIIAFTLSYGLFYAQTDFEADVAGGTAASEHRGWGTGFFSPLLTLDFYSRKLDLIFGVGLGGFLGTSYETLTAERGGQRVSTDESPVTTLTVHLKTRWFDGRKKRLAKRNTIDEGL